MSSGLTDIAYSTSLGHAYSREYYYPTDICVNAASYLTAEAKARILSGPMMV